MKQGIFTLQKLSQVWGANHQSLNTQLPDTGSSYMPSYPTRAQYRDGSQTDSAVDTASATWTNVKAMNSNNGETAIGRTTGTNIPINVWCELLINGRKAIASFTQADTAYFNSLKLNTIDEATLYPKADLKEGEFAFCSDGGDDIFLNLGGSPAQIVRFLRSDSHISYDNVEDIIVREINWMQSATPSSNLAEGRLWYDTTNKLLMRYDGTSFKKVYYLAESDNNLTETTTEGTGALKYNTLYVYCPFVSNAKKPTSIWYFDGTDLVELGGSGLGVLVANSSTSSSTAAKVASITGATPTSYADLKDQTIRVYFGNGNTYRGNAMTINFNSLGNINVRCSGDLSKPVVDNQTAGSFMQGTVTYYASDSAYVFAVDAPQILNASSSATYYPMLKSVAGSATTPNTFVVQDQNVSVKGSELTAKAYNFGESAFKLATNGSTDLVSTLSEWSMGNDIYRSKGIKRITVNVRLSTSSSNVALFTVPAGYVAVSANGDSSACNYVGIAWYRSTYVNDTYSGQTFNILYQDSSDTQQTASVAGADVACASSDSKAFAITSAFYPGTVYTRLGNSTNKGPVCIFGEFLLIPDGNQS